MLLPSSPFTLKMEAVESSETMLSYHITTDRYLNLRIPENLKSRKVFEINFCSAHLWICDILTSKPCRKFVYKQATPCCENEAVTLFLTPASRCSLKTISSQVQSLPQRVWRVIYARNSMTSRQDIPASLGGRKSKFPHFRKLKKKRIK
jgi:hypothetical protein